MQSSGNNELIDKIKIAASANITKPKAIHEPPQSVLQSGARSTKRIIAMGASTGGTEALFNILSSLPPNMPGVVIVQHIPPVFSTLFAERLNKSLRLHVKEAQSGDYVDNGMVLIAPGDKHMQVKKLGDRLRIELYDGEKVSGHCPSVDVLFNSVAVACGKDSIGVLLTGMGSDGAKGLLAMRQNGARTIGQDASSSVVYGMPKVAFDIGAVEKQIPLDNIAQAIINMATS